MTIEELREEATSTVEWESTPMIDRPLFVWAYTKGAEPREKRIAEAKAIKEELEAQIEKMKCCVYCKHYKPCVTVIETVGNMCEDYYNGCNNSELEPFNKWEIKDK